MEWVEMLDIQIEGVRFDEDGALIVLASNGSFRIAKSEGYNAFVKLVPALARIGDLDPESWTALRSDGLGLRMIGLENPDFLLEFELLEKSILRLLVQREWLRPLAVSLLEADQRLTPSKSLN